jgi:hypothetical protein
MRPGASFENYDVFSFWQLPPRLRTRREELYARAANWRGLAVVDQFEAKPSGTGKAWGIMPLTSYA